MYADFKRIKPGIDIGVELGEEWGMAEGLGGEVKSGNDETETTMEQSSTSFIIFI
jgi:hypothetical protein